LKYGLAKCLPDFYTIHCIKNIFYESLPPHRVIQWFKTMSINDYIKNVKINNWPPFDKKLWQRNYYECIIRNKHGLEYARKYILNNPLKETSRYQK